VHPAYFETRFRVQALPLDWPPAFAIISARATTGERWPDVRNERADEALREELDELGGWTARVVGFSPTSDHAEAGWAAELPLDQACRIGARYAQDAIYWIEGNELFVTHCDERRALVPVGSFRERVQASAGA
jgi:hypothetical protein